MPIDDFMKNELPKIAPLEKTPAKDTVEISTKKPEAEAKADKAEKTDKADKAEAPKEAKPADKTDKAPAEEAKVDAKADSKEPVVGKKLDVAA